MNDILENEPAKRMSTSLAEVDRVLGGGLLPGSLILLGGSPGVGKSTLSLHICSELNQRSLYFSAEESEEQVAIRAKRINVKSDNLHLSSENDLNGILTHIDRISPALVIIDSIQTIINSDLDSLPGSPSQIRDCGQKFLEVSKHKNVIITPHAAALTDIESSIELMFKSYTKYKNNGIPLRSKVLLSVIFATVKIVFCFLISLFFQKLKS